MRTPVVVGLAAVTGALLAGGVAFASGSKPVTPDDQVSHRAVAVSPLAAIDSTTESKFTAVAPCRAVDTRAAGGSLGNGTARQFRVGGSSSLAGQGGPSTGCGLPTNPTAVAVTITTIARHSGYLKAWAAGAKEPATSFMNYGTAFNASTGGNVPVSTSGTINIRNFNGPTNVIIDITGYFVKPMAVHLNTNGSVVASSRVTAVSKGVTGFYTIAFDRVVAGCTYSTAPFFNGYTVRAEPARGANAVEIRVNNSSGQDTDAAFYLLVTC